jgi:glycosyltransferase involved in cell wall biosynthesis
LGKVKVTVLMTLYNKAPYVGEAVRSVLSQSFTDLELLVVDDASTDGGPDVVRAIADPRIRILESERNTGRPAAANRGYAAARGEYVAVLDADDIMLPDRLAMQVAFLDAHPEVAVVGSWVLFKGEHERVWRPSADDATIRAHMLWGSQVLYGASMIRRSVLIEHDVRCNEAWRSPGMDYFLLLAIGRHGKYANVEETLTVYRIGDQNMRHGRDHVHDRKVRLMEAFRLFGLDLSEHDAALMVMWERAGGLPPTPRHVWQCRRLYRRLLRINRERDLFPAAAFKADLDRHWYDLFHAVHPVSFPATMVYCLLHPKACGPHRVRIALGSLWSRIRARRRNVPSYT